MFYVLVSVQSLISGFCQIRHFDISNAHTITRSTLVRLFRNSIEVEAPTISRFEKKKQFSKGRCRSHFKTVVDLHQMFYFIAEILIIFRIAVPITFQSE